MLTKRLEKISLLLLLGAAVACGSVDKKNDGVGPSNESDPTIETETNGTEGEKPETTVQGETLDSLDNARIKVRNFTQFYSSYTTLLEIPENDADLTAFFAPIKTNLPTLTNAAGFLGSHQLALVKFGSKVCDRSWDINTTTDKRGKIFGLTGSSTVLTEAFTPDNTAKIARTLVSRFWGEDITTIAADNENVKTVIQLITDSVNALTEFDTANAQVTITDAQKIKYGVVGACAAVLTSAGVSFYGQ
jgi:hypothetical protein